jgi:hypothetical protein
MPSHAHAQQAGLHTTVLGSTQQPGNHRMRCVHASASADQAAAGVQRASFEEGLLRRPRLAKWRTRSIVSSRVFQYCHAPEYAPMGGA